MFNYFKDFQKNKDYKDEVRRIFKSIDFSNSFNNMPTLEFEYKFEDSDLIINGPIHSFYVRTPYILKYNFKSHSIFLNNNELDSKSFSSEYKIMKTVYRKIIDREEYKKIITTKLTEISNFVKRTDSDFLSSSEEKRVLTKRKTSRNHDFNTDIITSSVSDSSGSSSGSRDRDSGN